MSPILNPPFGAFFVSYCVLVSDLQARQSRIYSGQSYLKAEGQNCCNLQHQFQKVLKTGEMFNFFAYVQKVPKTGEMLNMFNLFGVMFKNA